MDDIAEEAKQLTAHFGGNEKKDFEHKGEFEQPMRAKIGHQDPFEVKFMHFNLVK